MDCLRTVKAEKRHDRKLGRRVKEQEVIGKKGANVEWNLSSLMISMKAT